MNPFRGTPFVSAPFGGSGGSGNNAPPLKTTPNSFSYTALTNVALSTLKTSEQGTVAGLESPAPLFIAGGEYQIDSLPWATANASVINGQKVRVRLTSSASGGTLTRATLTLGNLAVNFDVTTEAAFVPSGVVQGLTAVGDISANISNPSVLTVPMQTNGRVLVIQTSTSFTTAAFDLAKVTFLVQDTGWDINGNQVQQQRTIGLREFMRGPYAENGYYQPVAGSFHVVLDDFLYNQDTVWRTTLLSANFQAGWLPGQPAETFAGITRQDSLPYFPWPMRAMHMPFERVASGETYRAIFMAQHRAARNRSQIACVEAWAVDSAGTAGPTVRSSTFARSSLTPVSGVDVPGLPFPSYEADVPMTGLIAGRVGIRARFKPWIGPAVESFAWGEAYPTFNLATEVPICYDTDGSHAPLYGVLANDPAAPPTGKTLIASNTNVATVDVSGLATSIAGASGSNKVYADVMTLATAVRRVNVATSALTLASGSYQRATPHNSLSGGVAVCPPVSGSAMGSATGAYVGRGSMTAQANFPPGLSAFEIRSLSGLPSTDVRWRGPAGATGTSAATRLPSRTRLRGLTADSTGVTVAAENIVWAMASTPSGAAATEMAATYLLKVDCRITEVDPAALNAGASTAIYAGGYVFDHRVQHDNVQGLGSVSAASNVFGALAVSAGCSYGRAIDSAIAVPATAFGGLRLTNLVYSDQAVGVQPDIVGSLGYNVLVTTTVTSPAGGRLGSGGGRPVKKGGGMCMVFAYGPNATSYAGPSIAVAKDGSRLEMDSFLIQHAGYDFPIMASESDGRANWGYNDQGFTRINKCFSVSFSAIRHWNIKGDSFPAPETGSAAVLHSTSTAFLLGTLVYDSGTNLLFQALQNVPAGVALSDTAYWFASGQPRTAALGAQPFRQGNADLRYHTGCFGNVACVTFNGEPPSNVSGFGIKWGAEESFSANYADFYTARGSDYRAKAGGPLKNRVAAGRACSPFYLDGTPMLNDGTDAAGAWG